MRFCRPGAALVSTMPTTYDAALEPTNEVRNARGELRASLDPDDFRSGFGVWSGTSFAAPVFAGQLAARLAAEGLRTDQGERVALLRRLLESMPGRRKDVPASRAGAEAGDAADPVAASDPTSGVKA